MILLHERIIINLGQLRGADDQPQPGIQPLDRLSLHLFFFACDDERPCSDSRHTSTSQSSPAEDLY